MCRSTAAPLMAMAGMAGTAVGVAIAVLREKADRRSFERDAEEELAELEAEAEASEPGPYAQGTGDEEEKRDDA